MPNKPKARSEQGQTWRETLAVHPAANLLPLMSPIELAQLGEDIKANGLRLPIAITSDGQLLDGRNRLDAMEAAGVEFKIKRTTNGEPVHIDIAGGDLSFAEVVTTTDPVAFVISANIHRRHLTAEQRQHLLITLIARAPEKSDRQFGKEVGVDHKTIASARAKGEDVGSIPHVVTRTDTKGRKQPACKSRKGGRAKGAEPTAPIGQSQPPPRDDIGPDSRAEAERLRVRVDELQADKRRLEVKIRGLEGEIEDLRAKLKTGGDMSIGEFQVAIKKWEETVATQRIIIAHLENENAKLRAEVAAPPTDDGLGIPDFLDRSKQMEIVS
jgi:hypothetical protein